MARIRESVKETETLLKMRTESRSSINSREISIINSPEFNMLASAKVGAFGGINFKIPTRNKLSRYLSNYLEIDEICSVLYQLISVVEKVKDAGLNPNKLLLNIQYIYYDSDRNSIILVYQPTYGAIPNEGVASLFFDVLYAIKTDKRHVKEFIVRSEQYIKDNTEFNLLDFKKYVESAENEWRNSTKLRQTGYQHNNSRYDGSEHEIVGNADIDDDKTYILDDETTVIISECDTEDTQVLDCYQIDRKRAYLKRLEDERVFELLGTVVTIGKDGSRCDCVISDESTVSRVHAIIYVREDEYYIRDNNSTNGTSVNGKMLSENDESKLSDGDKIMFASQEYEFIKE